MQTESLDYYWELAKKLIMVHGPAGLLKDDENIGYVASALMKADVDFDPNIGILEGYRSIHARFAILKLIKKNKTKVKTVSLNIKSNNLHYRDARQDSIDCNDLLDFISETKLIESSVLEQIKDRYLYNYTWDEISKKFGISKQKVKSNIEHGLSKIRSDLCM